MHAARVAGSLREMPREEVTAEKLRRWLKAVGIINS
jgi:hypothetical protein